MSIEMRWLGTACFEIVLPTRQTLIIDPYLDDSVGAPVGSADIEGCDFIFITHGHYDHILDVGKLAERFSPRIFCSDAAARSLLKFQGVSPALLRMVKPGEIIREKDLTVEVLQGFHVDFSKEYKRLTGDELPKDPADPTGIVKEARVALFGSDKVHDQFSDWMNMYPQGEQLNFVFDPVGGRRIYMAGSYPDPSAIETAQQAKAHITLLQVLPGNILPGLEEQVVDLAMASGCSVAIPQHHDPLMEGARETDLSELKRIFAEKTDIVFKDLAPGKWYTFE
jgi:L-ascorbate metabolism protein UlaG (beta-lactamase superfamily)